MFNQKVTKYASAREVRDCESGSTDKHRSTEDPDADLVHALKSRNGTAFDDLVKQHERRLLQVAQRITKNCEDAEDVVQDSFLNVFKHLDSFRGDCQFASWLTRITINQALMKIRGKAQKFVFLDEPMEAEDNIGIRELKSCGDTPEELYLHREFETVVLNLTTTVRRSSQAVLGLHMTTNLSEAEIAKALKLTLPAAKARLYRGRQDLQEKMGRHYPLLKPSRLRKIKSALITRTHIREDIHEKHNVLLPSTP